MPLDVGNVAKQFLGSPEIAGVWAVGRFANHRQGRSMPSSKDLTRTIQCALVYQAHRDQSAHIYCGNFDLMASAWGMLQRSPARP